MRPFLGLFLHQIEKTVFRNPIQMIERRTDTGYARRRKRWGAYFIVGVCLFGVILYRLPILDIWFGLLTAILAISLFLAIVFDGFLRDRYCCPRCGKHLKTPVNMPLTEGDPIRFLCCNCDVEWDLDESFSVD